MYILVPADQHKVPRAHAFRNPQQMHGLIIGPFKTRTDLKEWAKANPQFHGVIVKLQRPNCPNWVPALERGEVERLRR